MKNSHLQKGRDLRHAYARKLEFTDGRVTRRYTATELMQLLGISKQHAYRLIANPERLTDQQTELLLYKDLRAITDWGPGWYVEAEGLRAPNGYVITVDNMEYNAMVHRRQRDLIQQNKDMQQEIESLRNHVGWLHSKLQRQPEARSAEYDREPRVIYKKYQEPKPQRQTWTPQIIDGKAGADK